MSALEQAALAGLENQAFALMARLHVILRRQNGRVTDIEYMRADPGYCKHVLELAARIGGDDLIQICARLEQVYFGENGLFVRTAPRPPLLTRMAAQPEGQAPAAKSTPVPPAVPTVQVDVEVDRAYVGRLR